MTELKNDVKRKILILEDEPHVADYLETLLKDNGYETHSAQNSSTGLEIAKREQPNLVILDVLMPQQTGIDFYRNLRKDKNLGTIPIIVVSGAASRNLAVKKAFAVFDKPIDPEEFLAAVEKALE